MWFTIGKKNFTLDDFGSKAGLFQYNDGSDDGVLPLGNVVANVYRNYYVAGVDSAIDVRDSFVENVVNVIGPRDPLPGELEPGEPVPPNTIVYLGRDPDNPTAATFDSNYLDRDQDVTHNGSPFTDMKQSWTKTTEIDSPYTWGMLYPITVGSTESAYYEVLFYAGARIFPDFVDQTDDRIVDDVHNRTGELISDVPEGE